MKLEGEQILLRVYVRNTDKTSWHSPLAVEGLVARARQVGLAGATVLRGLMGLDILGNLLESSRWSIVELAPVVVEFVDESLKIARFLEDVRELVPEGLATLERAHVMLYRHGQQTVVRAVLPKELPASIHPLSTLPSPEEFPVMKLSANGQLIRIFIGDSDLWNGEPLYRAIVLKAKELGLAGATVLHGPTGYGANSRVHTAKLLDLSTDLPIVVELVDAAERIALLLPFLDEAVSEGLITIEDVRVLRYRHNEAKNRSGAAPDAP